MSKNLDSSIVTPEKYTTGFVLSIILTIIPFWLIVEELVSGWAMVIVLMLFATAQLFIQLIFFLHLGEEKKPKWNQTALIFALFFVVTIVIGSIWIMYELDYNAHPMEQSTQEIENTLLLDENYKR